jgi:hypothetical protein
VRADAPRRALRSSGRGTDGNVDRLRGEGRRSTLGVTVDGDVAQPAEAAVR